VSRNQCARFEPERTILWQIPCNSEKNREIKAISQILALTMKIAFTHGGYKGALKSRLKYYRDRRKAGAHVNFWDEALTHVQLGNADLALQALEKAYEEREDITDLAVNPSWDSIRDNPRFQELLRRVGLPVNTGAGVVAR
jgi:hypothetical protein